ncbi:NAD-dependent epimerase/dehydratase family protein [Flavobacterium sp. NG2]|uniref:NAD-dependent epimerase/dehydratase family protein n=1 Tax=Flavobacterium sp. NG2 TaxID=3097547 RepID=UPI002A83DD89|nr:NAD-dependent epimerase/dehydratase family protein [Flavobacterium sp. NG2]WPR72468.1 NAD-dependent epimerase/dehydratase family protein [Flavobacterium sp. NG2]
MILVTGGTGLVGAHLLLHLVENEEKVRALYRTPQSIEKTKSLFSLYKKETLFSRIDWFEGDITDIPSLERAFIDIDYVYHCAAIISFDPKDENAMRKTNIEGTANIVNFCIDKNIQKLCHFSSTSALGDLAEHETIITEETEWNPEKPHSDYAISKYGAEMELWRGQQEGLNSIIINPGIILGPGFYNQGSGLLFQKVSKGLPYYTDGTTGFIAVTDVVRIAVELMQSAISNQRYTLIAENCSFRDIIYTMSDALHKKRPQTHLKPWLIEIAWRIDWIKSALFKTKRKLTRYTAKSSYTKTTFSNEKIKADLKTSFLDIHQYIKDISKLKN